MNTDAFQNDPNDPLWALLGKAKEVKVSPFFARNVLREVRMAQSQSATPVQSWASVFKRWRMALVGAAAACCVLAATSTVLFQGRESMLTLRSGDAEVISNLNELLAYEDDSIWLKKPVN